MKFQNNLNQKEPLGIAGILLGLIGTVYLADSAFPYGGETISAAGRQFNPLFLDDILFKLSLIVITVGFAIQLLERIWDYIPEKYKSTIFFIAGIAFIFSVLYISAYRFFGVDVLSLLRSYF